MNKWLKDRQLGKTVKKETILENISKCLKFKYKGTIEFTPRHSEQLAGALQWINDGHNLVALVDDGDTNRQNITILKDQDIYAKNRVESKIVLEQFANRTIESMICNDSSSLLHGSLKLGDDGFSETGFISSVSLETGKVESLLRNRLRHVFMNHKL